MLFMQSRVQMVACRAAERTHTFRRSLRLGNVMRTFYGLACLPLTLQSACRLRRHQALESQCAQSLLGPSYRCDIPA